LIEPEQVVPAFTTSAPMDDESLVGLFSRTFERTVFTNFSKALARAGVATNRPDFVAGADLSDVQIDALARRLGTDVGEISRRLHRPARGGRHDLRGVDFHGQFLRLTYLARQERRVSPRALLQSPHHRALWDLRPLSFDMATMEMLLDTCPVCDTRLGWRDLFGPTKCDRCVDDRGLPSTDLRDFPQPLVDEDYHRGARIAAGLMHPLPEIRAKSLAAFPAPWRDLQPGDLFHLMVEMAATPISVPGGRKRLDVLMPLPASDLAGACSVLLAGREAFHEWAVSMAGSQGPHWTVDRPVALAGYDRLVRCTHLSSSTAAVLKAMRSDAQTLQRRRRIGRFEWLVAKDIAAEFGIDPGRARRFVKHMKTVGRDGKDAAALGLPTSRDEMAILIPVVKDSASVGEAAHILGAGLDVVEGLEALGLLNTVDPSAAIFLRAKKSFSRTTCNELSNTFRSRMEPGEAGAGPSVEELLRRSDIRPWPRAAAWHIIWSGRERAVRCGADVNWLKDVRIPDPEAFLRLLRQHPLVDNSPSASGGLIPAVLAAELLKTDIAVVGQLVREKILACTATRPRLFRRSDIDAFAKEYIASTELRRLLGLPAKAQLQNLPEGAFDFPGQRNRFYRRSECQHLLG
jgi:hypothetical protein